MLRAVRFAAQLGFSVESDTFEAIASIATLVTLVSQERITQELSNILTSGRAADGFLMLGSMGLLTHILPEIAILGACQQNPVHHPEGDVFTHTLLLLKRLPAGCSLTLALAALFHDAGKPGTFALKDGVPTAFGHEELGAKITKDVLRRMKFPNDVIDTVVDLVAQHMRFRVVDEMKRSKLLRFLRQPNFAELLELHRLDAMAGSQNLEYYEFCVEALAEVPEEVLRPARLVTGDDIIRLGLKPCPAFRKMLEDVETGQLEGHIVSREGALLYLKEAVCRS
jgi:poly(A) polymerase